MKELNTFRQFLTEEKDKKVSEDKIKKVIKDTLKKEGGASGIAPLKKAIKSLKVDSNFNIEKFLKKMSNVEKHKNGDYILTPLKENDEILDEIIDEDLNELDTQKIDAKIQKDPKFLKKVQDATEKALEGDSTELALLMLPEGRIHEIFGMGVTK